MRITTQAEPALTGELLADLRDFDVCTLSNAIETFGVRPATEGFADATVRCLVAPPRPILGYAVTARLQASSIPMTGRRTQDRTDWWEYILTVPSPRIVVLEDVGEKPGLGAFLGEVHSAILSRLGCVGAVTNGAVRDVPALEAMGFPVFAGNVAVSHCYAHLMEFGRPVRIGGMAVQPGDLLCGDRHGVLSIPRDIAAELPSAAARLLAQERRILEVCRSGEFSVERLRGAV
jgi:4-hydroxy-4-methyl-2-oxoglutarate aldolase